MKVDAADLTLDLVKAYVIKAFETCACYCAHPVIWHKKMLFPAHENVFSFRDVADGCGTLFDLFLERMKSTEPFPVLEICFSSRAPALVVGEEIVLGSDDLAFKVGCEGGVIFGQACTLGEYMLRGWKA